MLILADNNVILEGNNSTILWKYIAETKECTQVFFYLSLVLNRLSQWVRGISTVWGQKSHLESCPYSVRF